MIRNESEYQEASRRLQEEKTRLEEQRRKLEEMRLTVDQVKRALDPMRSFHLQLEEEIEAYERLKRGDLGQLLNLHGLGRSLVALRIARGITQRELAERLGVYESQVSRDERNDYHGVTVERAQRVLDALSAQMTSTFELALSPEKGARQREERGTR